MQPIDAVTLRADMPFHSLDSPLGAPDAVFLQGVIIRPTLHFQKPVLPMFRWTRTDRAQIQIQPVSVARRSSSSSSCFSLDVTSPPRNVQSVRRACLDWGGP